MVLCVSGHIKEEITVSDIDIIESIDKLISQGVSAKDAIKSVAEKYSLGKNEVYKLYHQ
jgi:16S rRNA C1402 (ribose-2'-O) methylase RsmI